MVGLDKPCKGTMLSSPSRAFLYSGKHPVTREVLGKPIRFRNRSCWKDRPRRWEDPGVPLVSEGDHGLPIASQSDYFDLEMEPEWVPEQSTMA